VKHLNEKGFTLLEMMLSLLIFSTVVFFLPPLFSLTLKNDSVYARLHEMEWDVFCSQIKKEIRMSNKADITNEKLFLTSDSGTVIYELYGNKLRRRVDFSGHEILLQNINGVTFIRNKNTIKVTVKNIKGDESSVVIHTYLDWDSSSG
jgi:competence protein ComGF